MQQGKMIGKWLLVEKSAQKIPVWMLDYPCEFRVVMNAKQRIFPA